MGDDAWAEHQAALLLGMLRSLDGATQARREEAEARGRRRLDRYRRARGFGRP